MKRMMKCLLSTLLMLIFMSPLAATTIAPYPNLGEMAKYSEAIVLVRAERNYQVTEGNTTYFATSLNVLRSLRGPLARGEQFTMRNMHLIEGGLERIIWGDLEMVEGKNYLLMLVMGDNGYWQPMMLSYGVLEEEEKGGQSFLVPILLGAEGHALKSGNGEIAEPLAVYYKEAMLSMLKGVVEEKESWNKNNIAAPYLINEFEAGTRAAPAHCVFLFGPTPARWNGFPSALPVSYHAGGDSGCPTAFTKIQGVIGTMNGSYTGINLTDGGTHNFAPVTCAGGAQGSEFSAWATSRSMTIMFDDPCNQIPDLNNCNGTLAFGGMYAGTPTHSWDGINWLTASRGYVVVNNGTGACQCSTTDYDVMMTHEMTHALGMGHISTTDGVANMNPSCCNFIQPLDIQCLDYTYLNPLPVELTSFTGAQAQKAIELSWTTASELDNDYFILERANLNGEFEEIAIVQGAGTSLSTNTYKFVDERPNPVINYYRLSQVDYDGTLNEGGKIAVDFYNGLNISLTPNPIKDNRLRVDVGSESQGELLIEIFDMVGKPVFSRQLAINRGRTIEELQLNDLIPGIYIVRTQKDNVVQTTRFVKSN